MADDTSKRAFIVSDFKDTNFNDEGVERKFVAGNTETLPAGVYVNYEAAGLVRAPTADDKKAAAPTA